MNISELLQDDRALRTLHSPEVNPLAEEHALQEAQVLDVRFDVVTAVVGVLFELRQALQLREASAGVLVVRGVREFAWSGPDRGTELTAWSVGSSVPSTKGRLFSLSLVMWPHPGAHLVLAGESAAFFVGDVPGLQDVPPDYGLGDRRAIDSDVATWSSLFLPVSAAFLDPAPRA